MSNGDKHQKIQRNEAEIKPNLYASYVLLAAVALIAVLFALSETGMFAVNKLVMRGALALAAMLYFIMLLSVGSRRRIGAPGVKYIIMFILLVITLELVVILNARVTLVLLLPMMLATQYRSYGLSLAALIGTLLCCIAGPLLALYLGTWDSEYLSAYLSMVCCTEVTLTQPETVDMTKHVYDVLLRITLPHMLVAAGFGVILFGVTRNNRKGLQNRLQVESLGDDLSQQLQRQLEVQEKVLCSMSDVIESRDVNTGGHVRRTSEVVRILVETMLADPNSGMDAEFAALIIKSAPMHDLGKIAIDDRILRKPGYLTPEEYAIIQTHPQKSADMIDSILSGVEAEDLLQVAHNIALYHHERVDGRGYPKNLRGEQIPPEARIMALADVYDALASRRYYKEALAPKDVRNLILNGMGTQFDAALKPYFLASLDKIEAYYAALPPQHDTIQTPAQWDLPNLPERPEREQ